MFGDASSFGHVVLPIFVLHRLQALSLEDFFVVWILHCLDLFCLVFGFFPGHCVGVLFIGQLFERLGRHVVPWSEHLLLVLLPDIDLFVNCAFVDDHTLFWVLVCVDDAALEVVGLGAHHVRHLVQAILGDVLHLERRQVLRVPWRGALLVLGDLLWREGSLVLQHLSLHFDQSQLFECDKYRFLDLTHVEFSLHLLVLVVFQHVQSCLYLLLGLKLGNLLVPARKRIWLLHLQFFHQFLRLLHVVGRGVLHLLHCLNFVFIHVAFPLLFLLFVKDAIVVE